MEDRKKAIEDYNKLKATYGLPELSEFEKVFDFYLEGPDGIIRKLVIIIWDAIHKMRGDIENMLQPQRYCCFFETKFFNNKEKEELFSLYKEIMTEYWKTVKFFYYDEKQRVELLKQGYALFKKLKPHVEKLADKAISGWSKKEKAVENDTKYIT